MTFENLLYFWIPKVSCRIPCHLCYELSAKYLKRYFDWGIGKKRLVDLAEGGVQKNLRGSAVLELLIPVPKNDEQKRINKRLDLLNSFLLNNQSNLTKLQSLKTGLMHDLLSGMVSVK